jgi:hypothetical protein
VPEAFNLPSRIFVSVWSADSGVSFKCSPAFPWKCQPQADESFRQEVELASRTNIFSKPEACWISESFGLHLQSDDTV